jgi:histidinol dehydrogenase
MRILKEKSEIATFLQLLRRRAAGIDPGIEKAVRAILGDVKKKGDVSVEKYTQRFDRHNLPLRLKAAEIKKYAAKAEKNSIRALEIAAARIRNFHEKQKERSWSIKAKGEVLGQIISPLTRVGVYVPGGKASYPSTVLMNVIPALVAGVNEIALCVPTPGGEINPYVMSAIEILGVREVYRIGGAQAIGAMAYGTKIINKVDKIVGPGNIYVALAKRMVFGDVAIDMIAGPSEILIIADATADPAFVAADLISQAEHDELASSILVTDSEKLISEVVRELNKQVRCLNRMDIAKKSLKRFGAIILTDDIERAYAIANSIGPEHLEIMTEHPEKALAFIHNAGAIFLGPWTPEPLGDYAAGPNHTLPTGGTARFSSPLGVYDFLKRTSILQFDRKSFMLLADTVEAIAGVEGLEAHANTIRVRRDYLKKQSRKK